MTVVYFAVEGETDVPVAERLIRLAGLAPVQHAWREASPNSTRGFLLSIVPVLRSTG